MTDKQIIKAFYDSTAETEWARIAGRPEFLLTCRFLDKYITPGMRVLDIGGGPGRYSIYLAERGCDVTLLDLSESNVDLAKKMAHDAGVKIRALQGDACEADTLLYGDSGAFDAVLLMGPLYHLLWVEERVQAVSAALSLLKPGGLLFASFITMFSSFIDYMKSYPESILSNHPAEVEFERCFFSDESYSGDGFTRVHFSRISEIEPFMAQFQLERVKMISQEGILSPCEEKIFACSQDVIEKWLDIAEKLADNPEYLTWAEHIMYIGRKE